MGGRTVVSPGKNFANSIVQTPNRRKRFCVRRTHTSGSSVSRHSPDRTCAPRRRPSSCHARSTGRAATTIAPITSHKLTRPVAASAPVASSAGTAGSGIPSCSATASTGRRITLYRSSQGNKALGSRYQLVDRGTRLAAAAASRRAARNRRCASAS